MGKYDIEYRRKVANAQKEIDELFNRMYRQVASLALATNININERFWFSRYPEFAEKIDKLIEDTFTKAEKIIKDNIKSVWNLSNTKNDELVDQFYKKIKENIPTSAKSHNIKHLDEIINHKVGGLNISQRVWRYSPSMKAQMQAALDIAISEGKSAESLAREIKRFLNEPDKLFRRVRDKYGNLRWSKNAMMYYPGQGVYRSSHKNALRLARTEINRAYRESDYERWQKLNFIIGYEIQISNRSSTVCPVCQALKGKYPKEFKFIGWHPQCRCVCIPIMGEEPIDMPENFKEWIHKNGNKINPDNPPEWYRDNKDIIAENLNDKSINKAKYYVGEFDRLSREVSKKTGINVSNVNTESV